MKNKDSHLNSIFSLLTGNRLLEACKLAAECHDYRLAMLLAQSSGGNEKFRTMVKKQIDEWLNSGASLTACLAFHTYPADYLTFFLIF